MSNLNLSLTGCSFDDVLLRPKRGVLKSRSHADITCEAFDLDIPIFSAPMPSVASVKLLKEIGRLGGAGVVNRMGTTLAQQIADYNESAFKGPRYVAIGLDSDLEMLVFYNIKRFVFDVAHAHSDKVLECVAKIKDNYPDCFLIVGNVATWGGASDLEDAGADAIKVGIGPGSVCTTRQVTGFGVPQLEAIQECGTAVEIPIIADGGIKNSGDIVKALAAGADAVMIGSLFAHADEAQNDGVHYGCASERVNGHHAPEGTEKEITETEPLEKIVKRLMWGLRSGISYAGATNIQELQENADWIRISDAGRRESKL